MKNFETPNCANGNPLENINLISDPDNNFVVIMKDGKIYKNSVQ